MERKLICICCPKGCHLKVNINENKVEGNGCKRGAEYAINEITNPTRVVTSTARIINGVLPVVPVKTNKPIPKGLNLKCINEINKITIEAPVNLGDILIKNVLNTGADIIACKYIKKI